MLGKLILGTRSLAGYSTVEAPLDLGTDLIVEDIFANFNIINHNPISRFVIRIYAQDFKEINQRVDQNIILFSYI
jgi:hypothetical protein